jgi:predicted lipoprotein with Yx(FWY)xxD motif
MQWDYKNHPLYTYAGDSGPDQANGEGIPFAGGHWHVARPA